MSKGKINTIGRTLIILAIFISLPGTLFPQKYILKTFTAENGLPHNNVREIITDKSGYLWLATWDGLSRYDGYEFRNYHHIPGDSISLPYFSVSRIVLDGSDNLWLQTDNGILALFNRRDESFSAVTRINGENLSIAPGICSDPKGNIWIISDSVMFRFEHLSGTYTRYKFSFPEGMNSLMKGYHFNITFENEKIMWLAGPETYKLELDDKSRIITVRYKFKLKIKALSPLKVITNYDHSSWYSIYIDNKGNKWDFSDMGLFLIDEESGSINEFTGTIPTEDFTGRDFFFWGNREGGLNIYRPGNKDLTRIPEESVQFLKYVCPMGKDIIWFSSTSFTGNSLGLSRLIFTPDYFRKYTDNTKNDELTAVFSIATDNKKNVWLGTRGQSYIPVITPEGKVLKKHTEASRMPGFSGPVRSIKRTPGGLWLGYYDNLLLYYDYKTENFKKYNPGQYRYRALEVGKDGSLYMGNNELIVYNPFTGKSEILWDSLSGSGNFRLKIFKDGTVWSGSSYGMVIRYDPSEKKATIFQTIDKRNNIEDICEGDNGDIWLAVLGGGLIRYNTITRKSTVYTTSDGLSNNTVYSVLRDRKGNIWASTDNGISRIDPSTGIIKGFGIAEGLDIVEFNSGASFTDEDGRLFFGGMGGAVSFNPDSVGGKKADISGSKIILTRLTVSGKLKILNKTLNRSDTIALDKGEDNFHVTIATSDFANSEKTIYRYKLAGHDKDWIVTDHYNRNINYDNLASGVYRLSIEATDRNGEWTLNKSLLIALKPFFYQTKLFMLTISLMIGVIVSIMLILYISQLNQKARQVQDELRLQALRGQMNPHFIFNSLNSINYFISNNDKLSANRYIADFARLIRSILSNMGNDFVRLDGEMNSIKDYLDIEHLRFGDKFDFELDYSDFHESEMIEIFPGLIQPFAENAIWHGVRALEKRKGLIRISLMKAGNLKIKCVVEDDGIGRKMSLEMKKNNEDHISRGIAIVKERLQIISKLRGLDYSLEISDLYPDRKETGTKIEIEIPRRDVS